MSIVAARIPITRTRRAGDGDGRTVPRTAVQLALATALLVTGGAGCRPVSSEKVSLGSPRERYSSADYDRLLARWTRSGRVVKQLDTALKVSATLVSPDYRAAYVARYSQIFSLPRHGRHELEQQLQREWAESICFVFAAATHDFGWNDFHRKHTIWRVALVNDRSEQVDPLAVERVRRSPTWSELYPYLGPFFELYRVRFPRKLIDGRPLVDGSTSRLTLRFAGPLGAADLVWQLR